MTSYNTYMTSGRGYNRYNSMKLAEALIIRADAQKRIAQLTATLAPGICRVEIIVQGVVGYFTAGSAAIADSSSSAYTFQAGDQVEVYKRSILYLNLVQVGFAATPTQFYWIDSGGSGVNLVSGDCGRLPTETYQVNNPILHPAFIAYPLKVSNPAEPFNTLSVPPFYEVYQFAAGNARYASTGGRHPGLDFFQGPVSSSPPDIGVRAVANGEIVALFDPTLAIPLQTGISDWAANASPTDRDENRAYIVARHGNTLVVYSHLNPGLRVGDVGDPVVAGQWIGSIAYQTTDTGGNNSHLHMEVRTYGQGAFNISSPPLIFVNPYFYFFPLLQSSIDQNLQNRQLDDGQVAPQLTQCFTFTVANTGEVSAVTLYKQNGTDLITAVGYLSTSGAVSERSNPVTTPNGNWEVFCVP